MTATLDRISKGRLLINVVTGGDPVENKGDGFFASHSERYEVTGEFLDIYTRSFWRAQVTASGKHLGVEGGKLLYPPVQKPYPPLYFGGSSPAAHEVAARTVDKYLTWGDPADVAEKIADIRTRAAALGREITFGIRLHVIVRETSEESLGRRRQADRLCRRRDHRGGPECLRAHGFGGAAADVAPAWRTPRPVGDQPGPVGGRRLGAGRRRRSWAIRRPWPRA